MARALLTDALVAELHLGHAVFANKADRQVVDEALPNFGIRIGVKRKTWFVMVTQKRTRLTLGRWPEMNLEQARQKATTILRKFWGETTLQKFEAFERRGQGQHWAEKKQKLRDAMEAGMTYRQAATFVGVPENLAVRVFLDERFKRQR